MNIGDLTLDLSPYTERLRSARDSVRPTDQVDWYLYDTLANLVHLDALLSEPYRDLEALAGGLPVADIGAADGDLGFTLEHAAGWTIDIIDNAATNHNGLVGALRLKEALGSAIEIHDVDLDTQFRLPRERYGLVFFLGILYHLQNPFYALRAIAESARYCLMSTRVARFAGPDLTPIAHLPVGYLVGPTELNDDPSNYWVLTPPAVERLAERAGWKILDRLNVGDTLGSRPDSSEHDERMFMLLESEALGGASLGT